ncbi:MAG: hypothetical protein JWN70_3003 [Planctomycetaceae bacterium]|nr:hypothetical protein [Planctomycetaceae bacterium]
MVSSTCSTVVGVFPSRQDAEAAVSALYDAGFTASEIGVVSRNTVGTTKTKKKANAEAEDAGEGAAVGAVAGAGIGALIGAGVLAGVVPVIGPALFAGTLGVLASNAAGGAAVVGVIGALTGWGVSDEDAKYYESEVASGRAVVTVTAIDRCDEARAIMRRFGATSRDPAFASTDL